jgi:hypothetical protein
MLQHSTGIASPPSLLCSDLRSLHGCSACAEQGGVSLRAADKPCTLAGPEGSGCYSASCLAGGAQQRSDDLRFSIRFREAHSSRSWGGEA